jgi:predicted Zn-ribbon and HTH transcriptional regulator
VSLTILSRALALFYVLLAVLFVSVRDEPRKRVIPAKRCKCCGLVYANRDFAFVDYCPQCGEREADHD